MPDIKEKPSMGKPRARDKAALLPQQTWRVLKEKYLRQLDQRRDDGESNSACATEQVEDAAHCAVDELTAAPRNSARERRARAGQHAQPPTAESATAHDTQPTPTVPQERKPSAQRTTATQPKERPGTHASAHKSPRPKDRAAPPKAGQALNHSALNNRLRSSSPPTVSTSPQSAQILPRMPNTPPAEVSTGGVAMPPRIKERARANVRAVAKAPVKAPVPKLCPTTPQAAAKQAARKTRQTAQQHMTRQMVAKAQKAARSAATLTKQVAVAVAKAVAALVGSLVGLIGGGFLLIALVVVIVIAAVANSPFGLFFAAEKNAPDTVSVAEAVAQVNMAYNAKLEELQSGDYDSIEIYGQGPDWPDVLAVFAVKTAGADTEGMDVATLDADRISKLKAAFWDMTAITTAVETIDHPGNEDTPGWTERILHITITAKTADEMRTTYSFTAYQNSAMDELLADRAALSALAGDLAITSADLADILKNLPADLAPERRETVRVALTLVGKVNYFWGGKSHAIGWDSRWGTLQKVWAEGSGTTGTYRPYGLDCSGYVDWIFNNSMDYIIGHGGGVIMQHTYCTDIPWSDAQPGDLAFFPDDSHIGMVVGRSEGSGILVAHCSSGQNNVVVTEYTATGFTALGRPDVFD